MGRVHTSQEPGPGGHMLQQPMGIPPAASLQCPLLSKLNTVPTDKGAIFKGLISIFAKQAMKSDFGSGLQ